MEARMQLALRLALGLALGPALGLALCSTCCLARDNGQWEGSDPKVRQWYRQLMQPDNPWVSCCGESDAFEADSYEVSALPCDPSIGRKAFRFRKLTATGPTTYDVRFTEHGPECDCMGYLRHGRCKHAETLQAAEQVFRIPA